MKKRPANEPKSKEEVVDALTKLGATGAKAALQFASAPVAHGTLTYAEAVAAIKAGADPILDGVEKFSQPRTETN